MKRLCRPYQRDHGPLAIARTQICPADCDQALGLDRIEGIERFELLDFVARALLEPVQICELFASGHERRGEGDGALERGARVGELTAIFAGTGPARSGPRGSSD